jgi:uncharacterized membrane protein YphA (DoxX/SURF4 family)
MFSLREIAQHWNHFFFSPEPVYTAAFFRIIFGFILLFDAFYVLSNAREYLGPQGLLNYRRFYERYHKRAFSLFLYLPPTMRSVYLVLGLHIVFVVLLIVGLFTQVVAVLTFFTLCSIVKRNASLCNGGDNLARILCFFLIFTSSGGVWSLDQHFFFNSPTSGGQHLYHSPWALRLMQLQVSVVYIRTVYWKLKGDTYRNGTALYYIMGNYAYRRFLIPALFIKKPLVQIFTWGALLTEFSLGAGLWINEIRYPLIVTGYLFHLVIEYMLNVHLFGWYMMAALLVFIDPFDLASAIHHLFT